MLNYVKAEGRYVPERLLKHLALFSECDLKVYLTLLYKTRLPGEKVPVRLDELAESLGFTRKSIKRSIARWQGFGLLQTDIQQSTPGLKLIQLLIPTRSVEEHSRLNSHSGGDAKTTGQARVEKTSIADSGKSPAELPREPEKSPLAVESQFPVGNSTSNTVRFEPKDRKDLLALDIAKAFQDENHLPMFRHFCQTLDEQVVRRAFSETLQTPEKDIKKSRTALFIYLIRKYAYGKTNENPVN